MVLQRGLKDWDLTAILRISQPWISTYVYIIDNAWDLTHDFKGFSVWPTLGFEGVLKKWDLNPLGNNIELLTNITMNMGFHYQTCFFYTKSGMGIDLVCDNGNTIGIMTR